MRRPSAIISPTISSRSSSLLDAPASRADGSFTRRGSQHTWRSFSSASSTTTWLRPRPRSAISRRHLVMHRGADRFIQFALLRRQRDAAQDRVLRRQFGRHRRLGAAQDERADARGKLAAAHRIALLLDRRAEPAGEVLARPQQPRHQEGELRPQLAQVVLDRRAGQAQPVARLQPAHRVGRLGGRALDRLRLVQHHQVPGEARHLLDIARQHRVGRDHDMRPAEVAALLVPVQPVQHDHAQMRCEAGRVPRSSSAPGWSAPPPAPADPAGRPLPR